MSSIQGMDDALSRINAFVDTANKNAQKGLWEAGLKIMGVAQKDRLSPIYKGGPLGNYKLTGNLRASGYVRANAGTVRPDADKLDAGENDAIPGDVLPPVGIELGFTAVYALNIHENMEGRAPKFLESVIVDNEKNIIDIIKHHTGAK